MKKIYLLLMVLAVIFLFAACKGKTDEGEKDADTEQTDTQNAQGNMQPGSPNAPAYGSSKRPAGVPADAADKWLDDLEAIIVSYEKKDNLTKADYDDIQAKADELGKRTEVEAKAWRPDQLLRGNELGNRFAQLLMKSVGRPQN